MRFRKRSTVVWVVIWLHPILNGYVVLSVRNLNGGLANAVIIVYRTAKIKMKYLSRVKGVTRKDNIGNNRVREQLNIESVEQFFASKQLGWWGYPKRIS